MKINVLRWNVENEGGFTIDQYLALYDSWISSSSGTAEGKWTIRTVPSRDAIYKTLNGQWQSTKRCFIWVRQGNYTKGKDPRGVVGFAHLGKGPLTPGDERTKKGQWRVEAPIVFCNLAEPGSLLIPRETLVDIFGSGGWFDQESPGQELNDDDTIKNLLTIASVHGGTISIFYVQWQL